MLPFNPIFSQSSATQSLKNFRRGEGEAGASLNAPTGGSVSSSVGARWAHKYPTKFYFLICNTVVSFTRSQINGP